MREGMGMAIGQVGYNNRAAGSHEEGETNETSKEAILASLAEQGSIVGEHIRDIPTVNYKELDAAITMKGIWPDTLTELTRDNLDIMQKLDDLAIAQDRVAAQRISKEIADLLYVL